MQRVQFSTGLSTIPRSVVLVPLNSVIKVALTSMVATSLVSSPESAPRLLLRWHCGFATCYLWTGASLAELYRLFFVRLCAYVVSSFPG